MKIEYVHASKYGNGEMVAEEFRRRMAARGVTVDVHHVREVRRHADLPEADLYVFSSPGRVGRPIGSMRRLVRKSHLPAGTRFAILTTEGAPQPDRKTGVVPTAEERARWQHVIPMLEKPLVDKGLVEVAHDAVYVTGMRGPLEDGWQDKVAAFAGRIPVDATPGPA